MNRPGCIFQGPLGYQGAVAPTRHMDYRPAGNHAEEGDRARAYDVEEDFCSPLDDSRSSRRLKVLYVRYVGLRGADSRSQERILDGSSLGQQAEFRNAPRHLFPTTPFVLYWPENGIAQRKLGMLVKGACW